MHKRVAALATAFCLLLFGCSQGYESDAFEKQSIKKYISPKANLSYDSSPLYGTKQTISTKNQPIWKVSEIEIECYYEKDNEHIEITELYFYDSSGNTCRVNENSYSDVIVEWWPEGKNEVFVDDLFFLGEEGYYIFFVGREYPVK